MLSGGRRRRGGAASAAGGAVAARGRGGSGARRGGEVRGQMPEVVVVVYGCRLAAAWRPFIIGEGDWAEGGRRRPGGEGEPPSCLCSWGSLTRTSFLLPTGGR